RGATLWERGQISCTSLIHPVDPIYEIRSCVGETLIASDSFTDYEAASQHAIDTMRSYDPR
ncbi:MAG: hypothetical protein ACRD2I_00025, partial [Vicinamibacterales bacterium]